MSEPKTYPFREIEEKWFSRWQAQGLLQTPLADRSKPKYYCLNMFPYPSGTLHVGHGRNYILGDAVARYKLMKGFQVLCPMGWDAFGLPAENAAIKNGIHPKTYTWNNIDKMKKQFAQWGILYDWDREIASCTPAYYRWTQWLFLQLYHQGLAYKKDAPVNWCSQCQTVLANEQVVENECERCGSAITQKKLNQWYFKITKYAERLLDDMDLLEGAWPDRVLTMQERWIGESRGVDIDFEVLDSSLKLTVFTTRPDTIFGVTFLALAPDHPQLEALIRGTGDREQGTENREQKDLDSRLRGNDTPHPQGGGKKSAEERLQEAAALLAQGQVLSFREGAEAQKKGFFTGRTAVNPVTGDAVPVWVANYVTTYYGTGAIMGVPAHDERDFLFAREYHLPVKVVVVPVSAYSPEEAQREKTSVFGRGRPSGHSKKSLPSALTKKNPSLTSLYETGKLHNEDLKKHPAPPGQKPSPRGESEVFTEEGIQVHSLDFDGLPTAFAMQKITEYLENHGLGRRAVRYKLRDWLLSRQRYWGAPIPIIYCPQCGIVPVPEDQLPVLLPETVEFKPTGHSPLKDVPEFVHVPCPRCGEKNAQRETDTIDTFVDSSWYYLRYLSARDETQAFDKTLANTWCPIDFYIGGVEHATGHLIYIRFITKFLYDTEALDFEEPAHRLFTQGMVCKNSYRCPQCNAYKFPDEVEESVGATPRGCPTSSSREVQESGSRQQWTVDSEQSAVDSQQSTVGRQPSGDGEQEVEQSGSPGVEESVMVCKACGSIVQVKLDKMSKSKSNAIHPQELWEKYGADTQRLYMLYMGPPDRDVEWQDQGVVGMFRFLNRLWNLVEEMVPRMAESPGVQESRGPEVEKSRSPEARELEASEARHLRFLTHEMVKKVTEDLEGDFKFNTAIAQLIELTNHLCQGIGDSGQGSVDRGQGAGSREVEESRSPEVGEGHQSTRTQGISSKPGTSNSELPAPDSKVMRECLEKLVLCLAPFTPHVAEELWVKLGNPPGIFSQPWPAFDPSALRQDQVDMAVQINGKVRGRVSVPAGATPEAIREQILQHEEKLRSYLDRKTIQKTYFISNKLINFVVV